MPLISVVVPTMNEEKYLGPCIKSIGEQTFKDFEVVAIDASTDGTPQMCEKAGWRVVKQKSKGISLARAEGFAATTGAIIACTDADTAVDKAWLENINKIFQDPQVVCCYGPVYFLDGPLLIKLLGAWIYKAFLGWNRLLQKDHVAGMNFAVRKNAYEQIGGFRADLWTAEDVDLGLRIRKLGKVVYAPQVKVYTSVRRLMAEGPIKFLGHHIANYLRMYFKGQASKDFKPIR